MNSAIVFLPAGISESQLNDVVRASQEWRSFTDGAADSGNGRIYWANHTGVRREYEDERWEVLRGLGAAADRCWGFDYSMGVASIKEVLAAIARRWPDAAIDLDVGDPMLGSQYLERVDDQPDWDWWR